MEGEKIVLDSNQMPIEVFRFYCDSSLAFRSKFYDCNEKQSREPSDPAINDSMSVISFERTGRWCYETITYYHGGAVRSIESHFDLVQQVTYYDTIGNIYLRNLIVGNDTVSGIYMAGLGEDYRSMRFKVYDNYELLGFLWTNSKYEFKEFEGFNSEEQAEEKYWLLLKTKKHIIIERQVPE